ncbi:MAG: diguanylate cyclase domain-containing protein [Acidimicrobiales bacterium]
MTISERPTGRVNAALIVATILAAALGVTVALVAAEELPELVVALPVFYTAATTCALIGAYLLWAHARAEDDEPLRWMAAGFALSGVAMFVQILGFPSFATGGGLLRTTPTGAGALYLVWHFIQPTFVIAALAGLGPSARRFATWTSAGLIVTVAWGDTPLPALFTSDARYAPLLIASLGLLAICSLVATVAWGTSGGRRPTWTHAWVTASLSLGFWDVALHTFASERFTSLWWASLSMRVAQYVVLTIGLLRGLTALYHALGRHTDELTDVNETLAEQASIDPLTGALNRRAFTSAATDALRAHDGDWTSVIYLDLNGFKARNDTEGHAEGDRILVEFADALHRSVRPTDLVARLGGDEFAIALVGCEPDRARDVVRRIQERTHGLITASAGLYSTCHRLDIETLVHRADELMYDAKRDGLTCCAAVDQPGSTLAPSG